MKSILIAAFLSVASCIGTVNASPVEKAEMLYRHGLTDDARRELIEIVYDERANEAEHAEALYLLGAIAFEKDQVALAVETWRQLIDEYPKSEQGGRVAERIDELAGIVGESTRSLVEDAVAQSYLSHGQFWSSGKDRTFSIDTSWIMNVDAAIKWYDKVIAEFPGTEAARIAFEEKLRTLLGWEEAGRYGSAHGVRADFEQYMPKLIEAFRLYERAFPEASAAQAFRYQIAQAHWRAKDWDGTRAWLNYVISEAGSGDSFYKDLAERRLTKVEY